MIDLSMRWFRRYGFFCLLVAWGLLSYGQPPSLEAAISHAMRCHEKLQPSFVYDDFREYEADQDALRAAVRALMDADPEMAHTFAELQDWLQVVSSPDGNLRVCSWSEKSGGTSSDMGAIAQVRLASGQLMYAQLDPDWNSGGPRTDVQYTEVYVLPHQGSDRYLLLGVGSYGGGEYHRSARLLAIQEDTVQDVSRAFGEQALLELHIPRSSTVSLTYDPTTQTLTHPEYLDDEETGFSRPSGRIIIWRYQSGRFVASR